MHGRLITFADGEYSPAAGEILAKDSILYSLKPETRLLRRQLWPIMQETMDTLVDSVSAGANLFKNMLVTNPNPIATKIRNIKNAYISSATSNVPYRKKFAKLPTMKRVKKMKKYPESVRTKTVSEDYVHTYNDETYTVPTYVVKSGSKNPYSQMGLKDYKHFEETVLRELEEKEEKKVEASLYNKRPKNIEEELIQGVPSDGWRPVLPNHVKPDDTLQVYNKPKQVGKLHTSFMASIDTPIHEAVDESRTTSQTHETIIEQPLTNKLSKTRKRKPNSSRTTTTTTTVTPPRPFTRKTTKEEPNYPDYFLNKQKTATKDTHNSQDMTQELNYIKRMKFYREHMQGLSTLAATTNRPPNARDSLQIGASEEKFVFITPLPTLANGKKMQRVNRQKTKGPVDEKLFEKASTGSRGSIKFSDNI